MVSIRFVASTQAFGAFGKIPVAWVTAVAGVTEPSERIR
jgi:hypothetical protein